MKHRNLSLLVGLAAVGMAQTQSPRKLIASLEGQDLYMSYCASCHGMDAKGGGPVAGALKVPVPVVEYPKSLQGK